MSYPSSILPTPIEQYPYNIQQVLLAIRQLTVDDYLTDNGDYRTMPPEFSSLAYKFGAEMRQHPRYIKRQQQIKEEQAKRALVAKKRKIAIAKWCCENLKKGDIVRFKGRSHKGNYGRIELVPLFDEKRVDYLSITAKYIDPITLEALSTVNNNIYCSEVAAIYHPETKTVREIVVPKGYGEIAAA